MDFSDEELKIEFEQIESSDCRLSSNWSSYEVCVTGNVVKVGRETDIVLYTRTGQRGGYMLKCAAIEETRLAGLDISMVM